MTSPIRQRGFSLLELSVVLVIIGLVTAMGISSGIGALESAKRTATEKKLDYIEEALLMFRNNNHRLPCPADTTYTISNGSYGIEAANLGTCTGGSPAANFSNADGVVEGALPVRSLNLPDEYMYDGWGRKFAYGVDGHMTEVEAFDVSQLEDMCGITVKDAAGVTPRSSGAIYTLVSFGPNGHGGFLHTGSRMNSGVTNTDALKNCHCTSSAVAGTYDATYVSKDQTGTPNTAGEFDNIVRFKERWQLINYDDQLNFGQDGWYVGSRVVAGFQSSGSNSAYVYNLQCGRLKKAADLSPVATSHSTGVAFTPSNSYMLVFSNAGCELYPVNYGGMFVDVGSGTAVPGCPAYDASVLVSVSNNGYLAITQTTAPYVQMWKLSGGIFVAMDALTSPGSKPTSLTMTNDYMLISNSSYMKLYSHGSSSYTLTGTQPASTLPGGTVVYSSTVSPTEAYIAATVDGNTGGSPAPKIYIWQINSLNSFTAIAGSPLSIATDDTPAGITFSPDGKYMAVGGAGGDNLVLYKIDASNTFTHLTAPTGWTSASGTAGTAFAFSGDSRYIAMITPSTTKPLVLFKRISAIQYKYYTVPDSTPASTAGASVSFNH